MGKKQSNCLNIGLPYHHQWLPSESSETPIAPILTAGTISSSEFHSIRREGSPWLPREREDTMLNRGVSVDRRSPFRRGSTRSPRRSPSDSNALSARGGRSMYWVDASTSSSKRRRSSNR